MSMSIVLNSKTVLIIMSFIAVVLILFCIFKNCLNRNRRNLVNDTEINKVIVIDVDLEPEVPKLN